MDFEEILGIGFVVFVAFVVFDIYRSTSHKTEEPEFIVTSRGRKLYLEVIEAAETAE